MKSNSALSLPARKTLIGIIDQVLGRVELEISVYPNIEQFSTLRLPFLSGTDVKRGVVQILPDLPTRC
jgi:hypothetical protein